MHDVVKASTGGGIADWIKDENFQTKYWPVYGINSHTGVEESFWPERYTLEWIKSQIHIDSFQLSHMNQPVTGGDGLFSKQDLHYGAPFKPHSHVMAIDPAVTVGEKSDFTGIAVIGFDGADMQAFVEYAKGVKLAPDKMRELVRLLLEHYPTIDTVLIETINGGLYVVDAIKPVIPKHIKFVVRNEYAPKASRIRQLHDYCQRRWCFLNTGLNEFVEQALSYPVVEHDDVIDAVAKGVHYKLEQRPIPRAG
jgi:phage terminase large subunit-like protein